MQSARMAQIRRDPASEVVSVSPRRDFRPTGPWVPLAASPFRPLAVSPSRRIALSQLLPSRHILLPFTAVDHERIVVAVESPWTRRNF